MSSTQSNEKKHATFTSSLGVIAATLGSAVGLGNIWKFPTLTGSNGGATFLLVYLISTFLVGLPVMISEISLGRRAKADAVTTFARLSPKQPRWAFVGVLGVLASFIILAFYSEVAGWVFAYIFKSFSGAILSVDPKVTSAAFGALVSDPYQSLLWQWLVLALVGGIIILGVNGGIEKTTKRLMPVLFVLLVVIGLRSLSLPGATKGLAFLFSPDWSKITGSVILTALGLSFFKLSLGIGTMITYGSYFRDEQNVPATAGQVVLADLTVSILAGVAVFPAVFAFGFQPDAGPALLFITIPAVFASMPFGNIFMVLFFVLSAIAATGAMLSMLEVPVAFLCHRFGMHRLKATLACVSLLALVGAPAALASSATSGWKLFGMNMFDLYDFLSSNVLMPLGGLLIALYVGWVWGWKEVRAALSNDGRLKNEQLATLFFGIVRFVSPVLILVIMLKGLKVF